MKRLLGLAVSALVLITGLIAGPGTAFAANYKAEALGWVVFDNGAWGLPGANVYGYICTERSITQNAPNVPESANSTIYGTVQISSCPPNGTGGGSPAIDPARVFVEASLFNGTTQCGATASASNTQSFVTLGVTVNANCADYSTTSKHRYGMFEGAFCNPRSGMSCSFGYLATPNLGLPIP